MDTEKDTVTNPEETVASEQNEETQEQVIDQSEEATSAGTPATGESTQIQVQRPEVESNDDQGVPWKNRAMEAQKRLEQMPEVIRQTVNEVLTAKQNPKYTKENIPQLRQYAIENPQHAAWVETQIDEIRANETAKVLKDTLSDFKKEQTDQQIRQQSENWVVNHPEFKDCFTSDVSGNKVWNMANPLTQIMSQILNTPDPVTGKLIKDRPDGLAVAAELAFGRYALSTKGKTMNQANQMKRDLRKVQKQTVTQGVGTGNSQASVSPVRKALDNYNRTYNKKDMQTATKAYLLQHGFLKEEQ